MAVELYEPTDGGVLVPVDYDRRSLENPAVPLSDPGVLANFGLTAGSGGSINVNEHSILRFGPFYRGVNLLSDSFASLPLNTMVRLQPRGKANDRTHRAYEALRWKPNARQTAYIFKKQMCASAIIWGNGYAFIDRSAAKTRLLFLPPDRTRPFEDDDGRLWYETFIGRGIERKILFPDEVLHLRGFSEDGGLAGVPLARLMARTAQLGLSAEKYGIKFFDNGARASGVMTYPPKMSRQAQKAMRKGIQDRKGGLDNVAKVMVLSEGAKWQALTINQDEAQFLETRVFQAKEIAVWLGIPPNKLGDPTRTSYGSLEQENQAYRDEGINPWLVNFEYECRDKLLSEDEKDGDSHIVEFNRRGLVQADLSTRFEAYNKAVSTGWISRDEVRDAENMNPIPDGEGEKFLIPANMVVVGEGQESSVEGPGAEGDETVVTGADVDIQATALNGAQIAALLEIVQLVAGGQLAPEAAKALIAASFPLLSQGQIDGIIDAIEIKEGEGGDETVVVEESAGRLLLLESLRRLAGIELSSIDRASKRGSGLSIDEECHKHEARLVEALEAVLSVVAPWMTPQRFAKQWLRESLALIDAGADMTMLADHRCTETVKRIFGDKQNGN